LAVATVRLLTAVLAQNPEGKREFARVVGYHALLHLLLPLCPTVARRPLPPSFWADVPEPSLLNADPLGRKASVLQREQSANDAVLLSAVARGRRAAMVDQTFGLHSVPSSAGLLGSNSSLASLDGPSDPSLSTGASFATPSTSAVLPALPAEAAAGAAGPTARSRSGDNGSMGSRSLPAANLFTTLRMPSALPESLAAQTGPSPWALPWDGLVEALVGMLLDDPGYSRSAASIGTEVISNMDIIPVGSLRCQRR